MNKSKKKMVKQFNFKPNIFRRRGSPVCKQVTWVSANVVKKGQGLKKTFLPIVKDWSKAVNHLASLELMVGEMLAEVVGGSLSSSERLNVLEDH